MGRWKHGQVEPLVKVTKLLSEVCLNHHTLQIWEGKGLSRGRESSREGLGCGALARAGGVARSREATLGLSIPQDSQPEGCSSRFVTCNEL